jgi:CHAT domain-containing protein/tetratricopeptide (TPR) repeat protein
MPRTTRLACRGLARWRPTCAWPIVATASVLALGACGLGLEEREKRADAALLAVVHAADGRRLVEPRLTGGFAYAACVHREAGRPLAEPTCSAPPAAASPELRALVRAVRRANAQAQRRPSATALHAAGVANLLIRDRASASDAAVEQLERAALAAPRDAAILSDLAAACYVRAQRRDEPYDLLRALAAANRAVAAAPALAEALFNRALVLTALFAETDARKAWRDYLELDGHSRWSVEADDHLAALNVRGASQWNVLWPPMEAAMLSGDQGLVRQIVSRFRQEAREYAERDVLPRWGEAVLTARGADAARQLTIARGIGASLAMDQGDHLIQDAVGVIDKACRRSDVAALRLLAAGHVAFRDGYALYHRLDNARAVARLAAASEALGQAGSPFCLLADFFRACALQNAGQNVAVIEALDRLGAALAGRLYPSLRAHVAWMKGLTRSVAGDPVSAMAAYESALELFQRAQENENIGVVQALLGGSLEFLGRFREAWRHCYRALATLDSFQNPRHRFTVSVQAADFNWRLGEPGVALAFYDDVVQFALDSAPAMLADARLWRALVLDRASEATRARSELLTAERSIARNRDDSSRRRNQADLALVEGDVLAESEPGRAVRLLSDALGVYFEDNLQIYAVLAHRARARAYRALHDPTHAEMDLLAALDIYQRPERSLASKDAIPAFLGRFSDLIDEIISFEAFDRRRGDLAFEYADRARSQVLPAFAVEASLPLREQRHLQAAEQKPSSLPRILAQLPDTTVLVQYAVLEDHLLVWVLRRGGMEVFAKPIGRRELTELVTRWRRFGASWEKESSTLSDLLLSPWQSKLQAGDTLVFIPDKTLLGVSFACLVERATGRYLVESHRLLSAPSATLFVAAQAQGRRRSSSVAHLPGLIVGDPAFGGELSASLPRLPGAAKEAAAVAALYGDARLLTGPAATRKEFSELVRHSGWLHFSGHAMLNRQNPLLSLLLLAPTPGVGGSGALYSWEIYRLDLRALSMVVISACGTDDIVPGRGEGVSSLARAFLAAGAPVVVASLWDVDDRIGSNLLVVFHGALRAGRSPDEALRQAQLALLSSHEPADRHPSGWGAFEVLGAGSF